MKIRAAITVFYNGQYVPPGSVIDLPEDEARAHIARFGECPSDMTVSEADLASVQQLNLMHAING